MTEEEIKALIIQEVVKQLTGEIYSDTLKPGMQEAGKALKTVAEFGNTILLPFNLLNDRAKYIRESNARKLQIKLEEIGYENIQEIHPSIAIPTIKRLEYTEDDNLVEMYLNLLNNAADSRSDHLAHPSFVNVISNLSSDEALILKYMKEQNQPICSMGIRVRYLSISYSDHHFNTTVFQINEIVNFKNNVAVYISNLVGLGVITEYGIPTYHEQYEIIEKYLNPLKDQIESSKENIKSISYTKKYYNFTDFGRLLLKCCLPES